ncbi:MAG: 50S ribosomal protein L6 [Candidatus Paceibacterota bacterium]
MSRIGKQNITIPKGVEVSFEKDSRILAVTGPHGTLKRTLRNEVEISIDEESLSFTPKGKDMFSNSLWGTYASHAINMIEGVTNRFEKRLSVEGVGFKAEVAGDTLTLKVGFSHPVEITIPKDLEVSVEKNIISVKGADKEQVGLFAANVRDVRKPEPYKGKGIRYENEEVRRKQGKRAT